VKSSCTGEEQATSCLGASTGYSKETAIEKRKLAPGQPFSQKPRTPTVTKEFQMALYDPEEADLEHFWNCCSEGFLGERL